MESGKKPFIFYKCMGDDNDEEDTEKNAELKENASNGTILMVSNIPKDISTEKKFSEKCKNSKKKILKNLTFENIQNYRVNRVEEGGVEKPILRVCVWVEEKGSFEFGVDIKTKGY